MVWMVLHSTLMVLMVLLSISMTVLVLSQEGGDANMGAITGSSSVDTFLGKNKVKTKESKAKRWTIYNGAALLVVSIAFFLVTIFAS